MREYKSRMHIKIQKLSKKYPGDVLALRQISLTITSGMFGLLGPNGAGKTTLMKILATLEKPTSGTVLFNNVDVLAEPFAVRRSLGYLPQFFAVYPQLTGSEFLRYIARLNGVAARDVDKRVRETLERVGLAEARNRKAKTYSGGMLRRLGIAQAIVHNPRLLIVDEPTTGLDPEERIRFRNLLADISRNKIILLSTHIVGDISSTCEELAVLSHGEVIYHGSPAALIRQAEGKVWQITIPEAAFSELADRMQVISTVYVGGKLLLRVVAEEVNGYEARPASPTLEDAYMYTMERHFWRSKEQITGVRV